jgi:hypothetical protein
MTVSSATSRNEYNGNAATLIFAYTFRILDEDHISVYVDDVLKTITTHYTVSGVGDPGGGSITFLAAPASGTGNVVFIRNVPVTQETDYVENDPFPAESHEEALDKLTMIVQQLEDLLLTSLRVPLTEGDPGELPAAASRASKYLAFDANGDAVVTAGTTSTYVVTPFMETVLDDASAADARTTLGAQAADDDIPTVAASQGEMEAGTEAALRSMSPLRVAQAIAALATSTKVQDFRLTLTTALPVTTADVTGATTIYCTPYKGNQIALYTGSAWVTRSSAQFSLALGTLTSGKPYDVFCYDNAGTPTLEFLVWTNDTTRATALAYQDGVLVKSGTATRRYLGTFYTTSTTETEDSKANRYLWNYYNRSNRSMRRVDTGNWTYTTLTYRQANNSTANQLNMVIGVSEDSVRASVVQATRNDTGIVSTYTALGLDSTTTVATDSTLVVINIVTAVQYLTMVANYEGFPGVGKHSIVWLEKSDALGSTLWQGTTAGMTGSVMA